MLRLNTRIVDIDCCGFLFVVIAYFVSYIVIFAQVVCSIMHLVTFMKKWPSLGIDFKVLSTARFI